MLAETRSFHAERILSLMTIARSHAEQLILICGGTWQDRSAILQAIAADQGLVYTAIGLPFAKALLGQPPRERPLSVLEMLDNLSSSTSSGLALDHIEILFDPELQLDPLRAILSLARRQLVLLSWPGEYSTARLVYARPEYSEYRTYPADDMMVYSLENLT